VALGGEDADGYAQAGGGVNFEEAVGGDVIGPDAEGSEACVAGEVAGEADCADDTDERFGGGGLVEGVETSAGNAIGVERIERAGEGGVR
jgi:hypothetical protein